MENKSEKKVCQNCQKDFVIEPDDFSFYEKIKVPPPTFCPECRFQRRLSFRNEKTLYKRNCDKCKKSIVTIYAPDKMAKVFCCPCWWGDDWDGTEYGVDYDPNRPFFEQLKELYHRVPQQQLSVTWSTLVNSDYVNHCGNLKNCYLIFNCDFDENVYYSAIVAHSKDSMELFMSSDCELCYEGIDITGSRIYFSENCYQCIDTWFSKDCVGCTDCFGCVNQRSKKYCIWNKQYSREEYLKKIKEINLHSFNSIQKLKEKAYKFWLEFPKKYMHGTNNKNCSGEYIYRSKNAQNMYQARYVEEGKYSQWITLATAKDIFDLTEWGQGVELICDSITVGQGCFNVKYSFGVWNDCRNIEYGIMNVNLYDCFGCVNLRKKKYCILNKQYREEEYKKLRERIISDMDKNLYVDKNKRIWKYGEFLPYDLSFFGYNETSAEQYFPLSKEEIEKQGLNYFEIPKQKYTATIKAEDIPDSINDIPNDFSKEILECQCGKFYKIVEGELILLKRFNLPIPRFCFDCRYNNRIKRLNPPKFYDRKCMKCNIPIRTSYAPDRPEIVYCEKCYQQEVY